MYPDRQETRPKWDRAVVQSLTAVLTRTWFTIFLYRIIKYFDEIKTLFLLVLHDLNVLYNAMLGIFAIRGQEEMSDASITSA